MVKRENKVTEVTVWTKDQLDIDEEEKEQVVTDSSRVF